MTQEEIEAMDVGFGEEGMPIPEELRELQTELINMNTKLVFSVATCDCENADKCDLYKTSKEIAKILKKLQDVAMFVSREGQVVKKKKSRK